VIRAVQDLSQGDAVLRPGTLYGATQIPASLILICTPVAVLALVAAVLTAGRGARPEPVPPSS
jgi:hypothetical protein